MKTRPRLVDVDGPEGEAPPFDDVEPVLASIALAFKVHEQREFAQLVAIARPRFSYVDYDNWNGGTHSWELQLFIPFESHAALSKEKRSQFESRASGITRTLLESEPNLLCSVALHALPANADGWRERVLRKTDLPRSPPPADDDDQPIAGALKIPDGWQFDGSGIELTPTGRQAFVDLTHKSTDGTKRNKQIYEIVKGAFGNNSTSSSEDWAFTDMVSSLDGENDASHFLVKLWDAFDKIGRLGIAVPLPRHINVILDDLQLPLRVDGNQLVPRSDSYVSDGQRRSSSGVENVPTYVFHELLGQGGFGEVFRATRQTSVAEFQYAVKVFSPSSFVGDTNKALQRFRREVVALQKLQHRGIVSYIDAGVGADGRPFVVMPLVEGVDVRSACRRMKRRPALRTLCELARAVAYAHAQGVFHRDLKPSNVLVRGSDGQPVVLDFGCVYSLDGPEEASLTTRAVGTQAYIPREVIANPKLRTPLHDVFSLGVLTYEIFSARLPNSQEYSPLKEYNPELASLDPVLARALSGQSTRYPTVKEFLVDLSARVVDLGDD